MKKLFMLFAVLSLSMVSYAQTLNCIASYGYYQYSGNNYHFYENATTGDQNVYHWDFGDGTTLNTTTHYAVHTFPATATYTVCLTTFHIDPLTYDTLCHAMTCHTITISTQYICSAVFGYYQYSGNEYHLYENATTGNQNTYHWDFGDGSTLDTTSHFVFHTFPANGTYTVCLTSYDIEPIHHDTLCSDTICHTITVGPQYTCTASFGYYQYSTNTYHFYENASTGTQDVYHWNFGDGTTLDTTSQSVFHTFAANGTYTVCMTSFDIDPLHNDTLCHATTCHTITIGAQLNCTASFAFYQYSGFNYHFYENATTGSQNSYHWDFGDGTTLDTTSHSVFHVYPANGTYNVCMTSYDIDPISHDTLCSSTVCHSVTIGPVYICTASFAFYQFSGFNYHFYENATTGNQNNYHWDFGDGTTLDTTSHSVFHVFPGNGIYNVCLTSYDIDPIHHDTLCSATTCHTVTIGPQYNCSAAFGYYQFSGFNYHFYENASTGDQNTYHWDFGDGTTQDTTAVFFAHIFPGNGTYTVCLTSYDIDSLTLDTLCHATTCHSITIGTQNNCVAGFGYYQYSGNNYHFYENASTGSQNNYHWDFGDGTTLDTTAHFIFHTFPASGTYTVCLTSYDIDPLSHDTLCHADTCQTITIVVHYNCNASFLYYQYSGTYYHFYENATTGSQNTYHWDFGDGTTLDTVSHSVFHTFPHNGTYNVCLTVFDIDPITHDTLCHATTCHAITIGPQYNCVASFGYYQYNGNNYHFYENATTGNQNNYFWDFGDGTTLDTTAHFIFHTFSGSGSYTVCLMVYDIDPLTHDTLCSAHMCQNISINPPTLCKSSFTYYQYNGTYYHFYENATTGKQNAYHWDFADGSSLDTTARAIYHTFPAFGTYAVYLKSYDLDPLSHDTLCSDVHSESVVVSNIGINESGLSNMGFIIYPNPAKDNLTIENLSGITDAKISIYNVQSQLLLDHPLNQSKEIIDISAFAKGVYIIKVSGKDGSMQRKLIKE